MSILARIRDCAVIALCCAGVVVCLEARRLIANAGDELSSVARGTQAALADWQASSRKSLAYADWMMVNTNSTIKEIKGAVQDIRGSIADIRAVVAKSDENLNGKDGVLPALTAAIRRTETISTEASEAIAASRSAIEDASTDLHSTAAALADSLAGIQRTADAASRAIEQMRIVVADPTIPASLQSIATTTTKAAASMDNLEQWTHRLARPANWLWRVTKEAIVIIGRVFVP